MVGGEVVALELGRMLCWRSFGFGFWCLVGGWSCGDGVGGFGNEFMIMGGLFILF